MKTKLLRKIRKQFKIFYYPNKGTHGRVKIESHKGPTSEDYLIWPAFYNCRVDPDCKVEFSMYNGCTSAPTKDLAINYAKEHILTYLYGKYPKLGSTRKKLLLSIKEKEEVKF